MIYTEIVPFDLAKKLKEKGYNSAFCDKYDSDGKLYSFPLDYEDEYPAPDEFPQYPAPTYAEVIDWLLEKHHIFVSISFVGGLYQPYIYKIKEQYPIARVAVKDVNKALYLGVDEALSKITLTN